MYYLLLICLQLRCVWCMDPVTQDLVTPLKEYAETCGYEGCPFVKENMLNVHIVPHTHAELGYAKTFYQTYSGYDDYYAKSNINMKRILDFTISQLWENEDRKFTLSDIPYFFHWWANRDGTVRRMVYQLLRQGRLHLVGGWGMPDEATTSYRALIDQFTYGFRKLNATFLGCARPLVAWQADSLGHSREFASLAAQMGFDALFINPISYDDELKRMREKELEFVWRGSDDLGPESDIFTHKLFDGYWSPPGFCFGSLCNDSLLVSSDSAVYNIDERVDSFLKLIQHRQSPHYVTNHVMVMMGKLMGYHDASMWFMNIDKLIAHVNEKTYRTGMNIHLTYSTPACYLKAVHNANPTLPVKQDDFMAVAYDKLTHLTGFYTSRPTLKYMIREGQVYLEMARQLQVLAKLYNNDKLFEDFNWIMGVMQDHTIITGALRTYVKDYYTQKLHHAVMKSTLLFKQAFNKLRKSPTGTIYYRCSFNISSCKNTYAPRSFIVVYNLLAWPVTMPVRLPIYKNKYAVYNPKFEEIKSVITKIPQPVMRIPYRKTNPDHELVFIAEDLPPLGYRSYYIEQTSIKKRRSIYKKLNRTKKKKYLTRQSNNFKTDDISSLSDDNEQSEYYDDISKSKIEFANILSEFHDSQDIDIMTPRTRVALDIEVSTESAVETSTVEDIISTPMEDKDYGYWYNVSGDKFIKNEYIKINLDTMGQIKDVTLSNGVHVSLTIQMCYYVSDNPTLMLRRERPPGGFIFKPMDRVPVLIKDNIKTEVIKTDILEELHMELANFASYRVRLYKESPVIEVDWMVGPIPIKDELGKDVFLRYTTDLDNDGVFYTDSNGRQTMKRVRFERAGYVAANADAIPGNIYPVTSKIHIEDPTKNIRFSIFNDRPQGATSLNDGQIDLMIQRRILTSDTGAETNLNETENDKGIIVRGNHYLYISKANYKPHKIFEKKFAKEIEFTPRIFVSPYGGYGPNTRVIWPEHVNEFSGINTKLAVGVNILTLQEWNDGALLLRLENYLEKSDTVRSGIKVVKIKDLFKNIRIRNAKETTLGANVWLKDWVPLDWTKNSRFFKNFNDYYKGNGTIEYSDDAVKGFEEVNLDLGIKLVPQQIRTFVVSFDYVGI